MLYRSYNVFCNNIIIVTINSFHEKFVGNKPLLKYVSDYYPYEYELKYYKFAEPREFDLYTAIGSKILNLHTIGKIIFGVNANELELEKYDFLYCPDGPAFVVHQRVLDKFNELCPDDIQALPMTIKNLDLSKNSFENKSFWLINVVDVINREKSCAYYRGDFIKFKTRMYLKDKIYMNGHLLAMLKEREPDFIFYSSLAKRFIKSKVI